MQGFAFWLWAFMEKAVRLLFVQTKFVLHCLHSRLIKWHMKEKNKKRKEKKVQEQRAAEDNAMGFSWIRQKQMDVSFTCMLKFLNNGS